MGATLGDMVCYKSTATFSGSTVYNLNSSSSTLYAVKPQTDNGVFVVDSHDNTTHGKINTASPSRASVITNESFGSTNMCTSTAYGVALTKGINLSSASEDNSYGQISMHITKGTTGTGSSSVYSSDRIAVPKTGTARIDKVELVQKISYTETGIGPRTGEIVYASGWSLCTYKKDGSLYDSFVMIFARCITSDSPTFLYSSYNIPRCENASFVFSNNGSKIYNLTGNNGTPTSVKPAASIPDGAMVSNNGICAVSCMASLDGQAAWLGYKNGVYKVYQGPKLLYGMPGDKMTIKGHDFVCLAYGPFYARIS